MAIFNNINILIVVLLNKTFVNICNSFVQNSKVFKYLADMKFIRRKAVFDEIFQH